MSRLGKKLRTLEEGLYSFWCPGCDEGHKVGPRWTFNGNGDAPTFSPSVLVTSGHYVPGFDQKKDNCWCKYNAEQKAKGDVSAPFKCERCHSFVTNGRIRFLGDCTHTLAGLTVDLPDFPT